MLEAVGPIRVHIDDHGIEVNIAAQYNTYMSIIIHVLQAIYLLVLATGTPFVMLIGIGTNICGVQHT